MAVKVGLLQTEVIHYPNLKTILEVEEVLKNADGLMNKAQIKKALPKDIMHQTLNVILGYLEQSDKILVPEKGVLWTYNPSKKLRMGPMCRKSSVRIRAAPYCIASR